jgi:hypothetical protein
MFISGGFVLFFMLNSPLDTSFTTLIFKTGVTESTLNNLRINQVLLVMESVNHYEYQSK